MNTDSAYGQDRRDVKEREKGMTKRMKAQKREQILERFMDIVSGICDHYCKYPDQIKDEEELWKICEECPLNKLI